MVTPAATVRFEMTPPPPVNTNPDPPDTVALARPPPLSDSVVPDASWIVPLTVRLPPVRTRLVLDVMPATVSLPVECVMEAPLPRAGMTTLSAAPGSFPVLQLLAMAQSPPPAPVQVTVEG